jgi:hypothetical protein
MTEVRQLAEIADYADLHAALRARAEALNISRATLDDTAGLQDGYSGKVLAVPPVKGIGPRTLGLLLGGLAVKLILVEDLEQLDRVRSQLVPRAAQNPAACSASSGWKARKQSQKLAGRYLKERMAELASLGGRRRAESLTPAARRRIARLGGLARWARPRKADHVQR